MIPYARQSIPKIDTNPGSAFCAFCQGGSSAGKSAGGSNVGAKKCTPYGEQMALEYGEAMAGAGIAVISGMARGIDGAGREEH